MLFQILGCERILHFQNFFRCTRGDDLATRFAALRSKVNDVISGFDHIEIVLDHE